MEQKVPVAEAATTAPGGEQTCARTLLRSAEVSLLNTTVGLDALYANNENAGIIVQEKAATKSTTCINGRDNPAVRNYTGAGRDFFIQAGSGNQVPAPAAAMFLAYPWRSA